MAKALLAALVTAFIGWFFTDWLAALPEVGVVMAVAVMGGFIIYFNEMKPAPPKKRPGTPDPDGPAVDYTEMDQMEQQLFQTHSLAALDYLIAHGRELEFEVDGCPCFLSRHESEKNVSLWVDQEEQSFSSMAELLGQAQVHGVSFVSLWGQARLITLF